MATMIERAARAACIAAGEIPDMGTWDSLNDCKGPPVWKMFLPQARAVLMAVRTPGVGVWIYADCDDDVHPIDCFTAMIDAIISETP